MVRRAGLPFLLRLVDDESEKVRTAVLRELDGYGAELPRHLEELGDQVTADLRNEVLLRVEHFRGQGAVLPPQFELFEGSLLWPGALYQVGQVVRHRREGYRGVILEVDEECLADDRWWEAQDPRPPREQPWFHLLVDASDRVAYVDQTSLETVDDVTGFRHPLLDQYFTDFLGDYYVRNERPWPPE